MKLPILSGLKKENKESAQYYLGLVLGNEKVTSVIFEKVGSTIKFVGSDEEYFKNTIEDAETEDFLDTLDKVITSAETSLPENVEVKKTLFGVKDNWIEEGKLKKEYLEKLKKAGEELALEPIGFLVSTESVINLITKEEGAPVTAILCDVGKKYITVSWVRGGKILETKSSEIHQSASYTVDTLLKHFQSPGNLPARVVLLDSEEDELTQEFISHQWSRSLNFLHLPQILSLPEDAIVKSVLLGAATQMGTSLVYDSPKEEETPQRIEPDDTIKEEEVNTSPFENLPQKEEAKENLDYVSEDHSMEFFGFVEGVDIAKTKIPEPKINPSIPEEVVEEETQEIPEIVKDTEEKKTPLPVNVALVTTKLKDFAANLPNLLKKVKFNKEFLAGALIGNKKGMLVGGIGLVLLLGILYIFLFNTKAFIEVFVNPKVEEKTSAVTFSSVSSTDVPNGVIASQFVSVEEEGSVTISTTGKKDIGNPAKGQVTIFNNSSSPVNFASGTKITSSNNLVFTLDNSVSVASSTGDIFSGTKPGTSNVNVTAAEIGQEYNLPSNTKFTIGSNSSVAAKNDNAFSGGSKKSVTVVSEKDLNSLLEELPKKLEDKAREDIKTKVSSGITILNTFVDTNVESKSFDKKENDEAKQVTLKGTVSFQTASYKNSDIEALAKSLFESSDTKIESGNLEVTAKNIVIEKNKDVNADIVIKAKILPNVNSEDLLTEIKGTSVQKAKNRLMNLNQVTNVEISISPNIPFLPKNLPGNIKNINLKFTSN
jgi:hypothetical protein